MLEMPVAMAVIAILVALLLPAVQQVREAARKSQCQDHLHNLAIAMHNYENTYRTFPPGWVHQIENRSNYGWGTSILPFVEQKPLYDRIEMGKPGLAAALADEQKAQVLQTAVELYRCPSDAGLPTNNEKPVLDLDDQKFSLTTSNYAGVNGGGEWTRGKELRGIFGENSKVLIREITDGTSNTILVGERAWFAAGQRATCGAAVVFGVSGDGEAVSEGWTLLNGLHGVNSQAVVDGQAACADSLSSAHAGGAQATLGDAKVSFISQLIDQQTLENLMDKADGNPVRFP
jgi:type II secretory pathway pseudopilin PulG